MMRPVRTGGAASRCVDAVPAYQVDVVCEVAGDRCCRCVEAESPSMVGVVCVVAGGRCCRRC